MEEELIDPAITNRIDSSRLSTGTITKQFRNLARMADEHDAANVEAKIGWVDDDSDEPVGGKYQPKLILRVERL